MSVARNTLKRLKILSRCKNSGVMIRWMSMSVARTFANYKTKPIEKIWWHINPHKEIYYPV